MRRLFILISFAALFANAQERGSRANFYSREKEAALGAQLAAQVRSQSSVIDDARIGGYVARVGNKLAAALPDRGIQHTFTVVDRNLGGSTNEPLALPGGYVFVPANLLLAARSEDELSGMLAHAIAHIAARPRYASGDARLFHQSLAWAGGVRELPGGCGRVSRRTLEPGAGFRKGSGSGGRRDHDRSRIRSRGIGELRRTLAI
jgi:hypothetical protein